MNEMDTTPILAPYCKNPIQITGSEYKNTFWIETNKNSENSMSALYKGQAPQRDRLLMSFKKTISYIGKTGTVMLDFMNNGSSFGKLVPDQNNPLGTVNYILWSPERQIGDINKIDTGCGALVMNPYFRAESVCTCTFGSVLIIASVLTFIIGSIIAFTSFGRRIFGDSIFIFFIPMILFLFIIFSALFSTLILPFFSKNGIQRTKSLNIFNLSDNVNIATVYSIAGGCCKYSECLCEIECYKELDQCQTIALISIIMVGLCEKYGKSNKHH